MSITPGAKHPSITIEKDLLTGEDIYIIKVRARPVDGETNKVLINDLSQYFCVAKRDISIISGHTSGWKWIQIGELVSAFLDRIYV